MNCVMQQNREIFVNNLQREIVRAVGITKFQDTRKMTTMGDEQNPQSEGGLKVPENLVADEKALIDTKLKAEETPKRTPVRRPRTTAESSVDMVALKESILKELRDNNEVISVKERDREGLVARDGVVRDSVTSVRVRDDGSFERTGAASQAPGIPNESAGVDIKSGLSMLGLEGDMSLYPDLKQIRYYTQCVQDVKKSVGFDNVFVAPIISEKVWFSDTELAKMGATPDIAEDDGVLSRLTEEYKKFKDVGIRRHLDIKITCFLSFLHKIYICGGICHNFEKIGGSKSFLTYIFILVSRAVQERVFTVVLCDMYFRQYVSRKCAAGENIDFLVECERNLDRFFAKARDDHDKYLQERTKAREEKESANKKSFYKGRGGYHGGYAPSSQYTPRPQMQHQVRPYVQQQQYPGQQQGYAPTNYPGLGYAPISRPRPKGRSQM